MSLPAGGRGVGIYADAGQRPVCWTRADFRSQPRELLRRYGDEHQSSLDGHVRIFTADARLRGRRGRHVSALAAHDDAARRKIGAAFHARALRDHTYAQRAVQAEAAFRFCLTARESARSCAPA